ncbi:MAG: hypothetical protein GY953_00300 [bacterium]|nr:hypothetical protein [bacterium]
MKRLKEHGFDYEVQHLKYPDAGHLAGEPIMALSWRKPFTHPVGGVRIDFGGTPRGDALSQLDAMPKVLEFLRRSLQ